MSIRIEDLPYSTSPAIQFVYESTAYLSIGQYAWNDQPQLLTPNRPLINNALYFFRSLSLASNVSELDFTSAIVNTPKFYTFLLSDARAVLFREPVSMNKHYEIFDFRYAWRSQQADDKLLAAFTGLLDQTAALIGRNSITLKCSIAAQEITDEEFIKEFTREFGHSPEMPGRRSEIPVWGYRRDS